jgi:aminoglycoside 6'-N-acetyltransferase
MLFQNGNLKVRKLEEKDRYSLAKWLSNPLVLAFYEGRDNAFDLDKVKKVFYSSKDDEGKSMVEFGGNEIGYIQFYPLDDARKRKYGYFNENIYGIDQFIGEVEYWNKGIGTLLVTSMVKYLMDHKKAVRVVMDPQTRNTRAIKCYEKCGFKKVRILPNHELHEGKYHDCWLIEYHK